MKRTFLLLTAILLLPSCQNMDPETQRLLAQGAIELGKAYLIRDKDNKQVILVTEDGPDTAQRIDPVHGPNFGTVQSK